VELADDSWLQGNIVLDRNILAGSERDFGVSIAGGFVRFGTGAGDAGNDTANTIEGNAPVLDDSWHHVALVRRIASGRKQIFVDGVLDFESAPQASYSDLSFPDDGISGAPSLHPYLVIGAEKYDQGAGFASFSGDLDELRIWRVPRSAAQIAASFDLALHPSSMGLVGYYPLEAGTGTTIHDRSVAFAPTGELRSGIVGEGEWLSASADPNHCAPLQATDLPPGFVLTQLVSGLNEPTTFAFAPDGRLLVGQRTGEVLVVENDALLAAPLVQVATDNFQAERGLQCLTLHPDFANNGFLYLFYTTPEPRTTVARFTVIGNTADPASETLIWESPELAATYHHGGALRFGSDDHLYVTTGDQFLDLYSQNLLFAHGKLLRMADDGSIPPDNPFLTTFGAHPYIYARGLRNPFRLARDSQTGELWIGDVGGNNLDSWEEIYPVISGGNYGWPDQEGPDCFVQPCLNLVDPLFYYQHNDPRYYVDQPQAAVVLGPRYRSSYYPEAYRSGFFFGDYANRWIRRLVLDSADQAVAEAAFLETPQAGTIVDLAVGPEGALYFLTLGTPWSGNPDLASIYRIDFPVSQNQPPVAVASASPSQGPLPLNVQFAGSSSFDPDQRPLPLTFHWDFGDSTTSSLADPSHSYSVGGIYQVTLTVDDGRDCHRSSLTLIAGTPPGPQILLPLAGHSYQAGDQVSFLGSATDAEDGTLGPAAFSWQVLLIHAGHSHPFVGPFPGIDSGEFTIPTTGHEPEHSFFQLLFTATDSTGLQSTATLDLIPEQVLLHLTSEPPGIALFLDGQPFATPRTYEGLAGFEHQLMAPDTVLVGQDTYEFDSWSQGGERDQTWTTPVAAQSPGIYLLVANYRRVVPKK
jgi:glucose/arabinose dehydrogenase